MKQLKVVLLHIMSFEFLFAAFLMAGTFKAAPVFKSIPFDLTVFFLLTSGLAAFVILYRKVKEGSLSLPHASKIYPFYKNSICAIILFYALFLWAVLSLLYSPSTMYSTDKVLRFGILTGWAFLGMSLIISVEVQRAKRLFLFLFGYGLLMALLAIKQFFGDGGGLDFVIVLENTHIALGRITGMAAILAFIGCLYAKRRCLKFFYAATFVILIAAVIISGSRGPTLAVILTLMLSMVLVLWGGKDKFYRRRSFSVLGLIFVFSIFAYHIGLLDLAITRFSLLFSQPTEGTSGFRLDVYSQALTMWLNSPVAGVGIGGFPVEQGYGDARIYPHNIVFEVLAELGLVGLVLLGLFFYICFKALPPLKVLVRHPIPLTSLLLFVYLFFNALVSGDINDNRLLFAFAGLLTIGRFYPYFIKP